MFDNPAATYRSGMVNVQLGSPLKAKSMSQASSTARNSSETFQRTPKVRNLAFRVDRTRERKPVASLRLKAVVRRLLRNDGYEAARLRMSCETASIARMSMLQQRLPV